jgi:hypothetical protein
LVDVRGVLAARDKAGHLGNVDIVPFVHVGGVARHIFVRRFGWTQYSPDLDCAFRFRV